MTTLSFISQPTGVVAAYNPIEYKVRVSPTGAAQSVNIAIYDADAGFIAQWSQRVDVGIADTFTFRVEQILQDRLGYNLHATTSSGVVAAPNSVARLLCVFKNDAGTVVLISSIASVINSCLQPDEAADLSAYVMEGTGAKRFLTNALQQKDVCLEEHEMLSIAANTTTSLVAHVKKYTHGNPTPAGITIALPAMEVEKKRFDIGIGPQNLNQYQSGFLDSSHSHYEVSITSSSAQNLFFDMDNGTMETTINGFLAGPGSTTYQHSTAQARTGTHSVQVNFSNGPSDGSYHVGWKASSILPLAPNSFYTFSCYAYCTGTLSTTSPPAMRIGVEGLSDATVTYLSTWAAGAQNQWVLLRTQVLTGQDTNAKFLVEKAGAWAGVVVYFDDASVSGANAFSEVRTYRLASNKPDTTRVHFLNRLGGFDSYTFTGAERRNTKTSSSTFQKLKSSNFNPPARGKQVLQKEGSVRLSCSSDALRPEEMLWLEELLTSPTVYVQKGSQHIPVTIRDGEFEVVDPVKNIHLLRVELEYANDMVLQRG